MAGRLLVLAAILWTGYAAAQEAAAARFDPERSRVAKEGGGLLVEIGLTQPVPWRVYFHDAPPRLVVEFQEIDWTGAEAFAADFVLQADPARLVVGLAGPMRIEEAGMVATGAPPRVTVRLVPADAESFAAAAVPDEAPSSAPGAAADRIVVALDPGHGGLDPGAERDGVREADLMLALARELAEAVDGTPGMAAVLTRDDDTFVPLAARMSRARAAGADVLVSLHADALETDAARGASVYTLSETAGDAASRRMAERHGRADLLSGLDLSGQDDTVATVLMDLARLQTGPAGERLAEAMVVGLQDAGAPLNTRPLREAPLVVLNAADFPSVLVETGFLSSEADRVRLSTPAGRAAIVAGLLAGLRSFAATDTAAMPLERQ